MKAVTKIITCDGGAHDSTDDAKRHLEKVYGLELTRLAHRIIKAEKYVKITELLDSETDTLRNLIRLKDDMEMSRADDEND